ncbi:cupin domain-containing protein [Nocardia sp. CA-151230]|uniref:cupin domain-containing protein n=1 Tax=Nocardia sp. CA-151230 TaxID=3239982 RepID=UPI003D8B3C95
MERLTNPPTGRGPVDWFTGVVWFDQIYRGEEPSRTRVNTVRFAPCARTAWHTHAVGQTPHVTDGIGLVAGRSGRVIVMPGKTVHTLPGEWHWHGAVSDRFMSHLAIWEGTGDPDQPETTWGVHVTDDEYSHAAAHLSQP